MRCALWYVDHDTVKYELFDSSYDAAHAAVLGEEELRFSVLGVQYETGNVVNRRSWMMYDVVWNQRVQAATARASDDRPTRPVRDPFLDRPVDVAAADPDWLGVLSAE